MTTLYDLKVLPVLSRIDTWHQESLLKRLLQQHGPSFYESSYYALEDGIDRCLEALGPRFHIDVVLEGKTTKNTTYQLLRFMFDGAAFALARHADYHTHDDDRDPEFSFSALIDTDAFDRFHTEIMTHFAPEGRRVMRLEDSAEEFLSFGLEATLDLCQQTLHFQDYQVIFHLSSLHGKPCFGVSRLEDGRYCVMERNREAFVAREDIVPFFRNVLPDLLNDHWKDHSQAFMLHARDTLALRFLTKEQRYRVEFLPRAGHEILPRAEGGLEMIETFIDQSAQMIEALLIKAE